MPPAGIFRGLAQHLGYGGHVAAFVEISIDASGKLRIRRIVASADCGRAVKPKQIAAQIEGSFVHGLSAARSRPAR
jgi:isoquinoline 1-oxidoreductase beta subunit